MNSASFTITRPPCGGDCDPIKCGIRCAESGHDSVLWLPRRSGVHEGAARTRAGEATGGSNSVLSVPARTGASVSPFWLGFLCGAWIMPVMLVLALCVYATLTRRD